MLGQRVLHMSSHTHGCKDMPTAARKRTTEEMRACVHADERKDKRKNKWEAVHTRAGEACGHTRTYTNTHASTHITGVVFLQTQRFAQLLTYYNKMYLPFSPFRKSSHIHSLSYTDKSLKRTI